MGSRGSSRSNWEWGLLRRADQACCAALIALSIGLLAVTWLYQGGLSGRVIDVDRSSSRPLVYELDVNRAEWQEWSVLPGIGETLARRIVAERQERGAFRSLEDLQRVAGIGPRTVERLRPYLLPVEEGVRDEAAQGDEYAGDPRPRR